MYDDVTGLYMCTFGWDSLGVAPYSVMAQMIIMTIPVYCMYSDIVYIPSAVIHTY